MLLPYSLAMPRYATLAADAMLFCLRCYFAAAAAIFLLMLFAAIRFRRRPFFASYFRRCRF